MNELIAGTADYDRVKREIQSNYGVQKTAVFDPKYAIRARVDYLKHFLKATGRKGFVLGISGGVDSSTAGRLCQMACEELRAEGYAAQFIAMRLPAGVQNDEDDAQKALSFINPDKVITVNVGGASNLLNVQGITEFEVVEDCHLDDATIDYHKGNIKARMRMIAQYHMAALYGGLVVGTDHNAECVMGFYTLHGDGACDLTVLNGVNKKQIRLMSKELGAPESVWSKLPTADLEELKPGKLDDEGFGFEYHYLDSFLEGEPIPEDVEYKIVNHYNQTRFKRSAIPGFSESPV